MVVSIAVLAVAALVATTGAVMAAPPEKVSAFVCPVITPTAVGEHNPNAVPIGEGHWTIGPSTTANDLMVPIHATNGDGQGTPPGPHSQPGDIDYTAIWARQPN